MKCLKLMLIALFFFGASVMAPRWGYAVSPFLVTVSTIVPNSSVNGSGAFTGAGYPQATGTTKIRKITLSNDGAAERVTLWKACTSSTTATAIWDGIVPSSTTATLAPGMVIVDFLPTSMVVVSPCIHKGLNGSGTVKASIVYE